MATGVIWLTEGTPSVADRAALAALRRCSLVWVLAAPQVEALQASGVPASRIAHLPFGVDATFFDTDDSTWSEEELVVSVGNDRHRDWPTLLKSFELLRSVRPSAQMVLVTRAELSVSDGVTVHRHLTHTQLRALYQRARVVAIATRHNMHVSGMTAALESKAMRRPVVMTRTPGVDTYVHNGVDGLLVPTREPQAMAESLVDLLSDGLAARRMGQAGRRSVQTALSTEVQARTLAQLVARHC